MHGRRTEPNRSPVFQVFVDLESPLQEDLPFGEKLSVVCETMHANFKAPASEISPKRSRDRVSFRHKVEARPEPKSFFQGGQGSYLFMAPPGINIMEESKGKLLSVRPADPSLRHPAGGFGNRPCVTVYLPPMGDYPSPKGQLKSSGYEWLQGVVDII